MKKIKEKWSNKFFIEEIEDVLKLLMQKGAVIKNIDLAGIIIASSSPIKQLQNAHLYQSNLNNVNMSHSFISCFADESLWNHADFSETKFDRCTMCKSNITECNFNKSKLVINADDTIFSDCNFTGAKIGIGTYGYEYGGRRTKFYNCNFTGTEFKSVEFRASKFYNCNFTRTRFISCDLRGIKFEGNAPTIEQYERMKIPEMTPENIIFQTDDNKQIKLLR